VTEIIETIQEAEFQDDLSDEALDRDQTKICNCFRCGAPDALSDD